MAIPRLPLTASFTGVWPKRGSSPCQFRELRNEAAGLLSASSSWGLGIKAEHLVSSDDFQGGGGRSSPEMSDTSGVSHNSDSGGGSGTWKGEPDVEGEKKAIPVFSTPTPTFKPRCGLATHQATALHNV